MCAPALIMEECAIEHLDARASRSVTLDLGPGASAGSNGSADRMRNRGRRFGGRWSWALNFIDTALAYGDGHSEELVGEIVRSAPGKVYVATKVPPMNQKVAGEIGDRD